MKRKKSAIVYAAMLVIAVAVMVFGKFSGLDTLQLFSGIIAAMSVVLLGIELFQTRKVSEGEFLANLNQMFVENESYRKAYTLFENYDFENCPDLELENVEISNYLTFFEVFQLLIDRDTLTIDMFDDLFGYRFFIAVHNPYVQKQKLVKLPNNFRNLYRLEWDWRKYREKKGTAVFHDEYSLDKQLNNETYKAVVQKKR